MAMRQIDKAVEILLVTMLFKEAEWSIVDNYWDKRQGEWGNVSSKAIYRFRNKPYELNVSVDRFRSLVEELLDLGYKFSVKAFGRKTTTNTLLSAVALSLLPKDLVKEAVKNVEVEKFIDILTGESVFPGQYVGKYDSRLFYTDVLYLLLGKIGMLDSKQQGYLSALYFGDVSRFWSYANVSIVPTFSSWKYTTTFLSDAVENPKLSLLVTESQKDVHVTEKMIEAVRLDKIKGKELKEVEEMAYLNPSLLKGYPSIAVALYRLSKEKPLFKFVFLKYYFHLEKFFKKIDNDESTIEITPAKKSKNRRVL